MATSQSPKSAPSAVPPPPRSSSLSDHLLLTPSPPPPHLIQSRGNSPTTTNFHVKDTVPSMAPSSSPSTNSTSPASSPPHPSEQPAASPPPPSTASPPPVSASPPPKEVSPPPAASSPPPPLPDPPNSSPPPPTTPIYSPPPAFENPPVVTPVTPSPNPPATSSPPASSNPPSTSPPPLSAGSDPPQFSPPPVDGPPQNSPSSPSSQPPQTPTSPPDSGSPPEDSAPSPESEPPTNSTSPPSTFTPPPLSPDSQPSPNSSGTPVIPVSSPPSGVSPPSPTQLQVPPSSILTRDSNAPSRNGTVSTGVAVGIGVVLGFLLLGAIGIAAWCTSKRRKRVVGMPTSLSSSPNTDSSLKKAQKSPAGTGSRSASEYQYSPSEGGGIGNSRSWFTYDALVEATNGFSEENVLGEGGFGRVYKGRLPDGQEVAVKQLKIGGGQGEREFKAEVDIISRIHHRHLVSLAGYCISDSRRLLVYEYVPNNTLHFHLHGADRPVMTWETRVKIAAGAARGIAYLHEDCLPRIIHRDIKSANILIDKNFDARVSDFGLAKLAEDANSHVTTRVMGTFGYMAPEYASSGKLTEKSDVFSFGVVLLELITGRRPVDTSQPLGQESLAEWARPKLSHARLNFQDLVDPRLEKNYVDSEMFRAIEAAAACVRHSVTKRPTMGQVVRAFESMISADLTNGMRVGESAIYNSAEQSAEIKLFRRMAFGQGSQDFSMDTFSQGSWNNERTSGASIRET